MRNFSFKKFGLLLLFSSLLVISSCEENNINNKPQGEYNRINDWIQEWMDVVYFWNTRMPTKTDKTLFPADYFKSLLYKTEDRFSYIAEDYAQLSDQLSGVQMEAGYDFSLLRADTVSENVVGIINYIKPNSPASLTDLRRGDVFYTVNNKQLTLSNYQQLLNEMSALHVLGVFRNGALQPISLAVTRYEENPVLLDSIYELSGKKIAYLIFNFFSTDKGDNSYIYLKELNEIFGKYQHTHVEELILDLRYNGGGEVTVATALASMISNCTSSDVFLIDRYNSIVDAEFKKAYGNDYNKTFFVDSLNVRDKNNKTIEQIPVNKLTGLRRLYVLTSYRTASASELIINGLKPYMEVVLVGEKTYGKNVGMWFIYEEDTEKQKDNRWGMLPIVVRLSNSDNQSDYTHGFGVDVEVNEYVAPFLPLGNTRELLLEAALAHIGVQTANSVRNAEKRFDSQPFTSSIDRTPVRENTIIKNKLYPNK